MYQTRADLMTHPAFAGLDTDSSGNPCVWENYYENNGSSWSSNWSCQCDDGGVEPYDSKWLPPGEEGDDVYQLWESLPEQDKLPLQREQEALTGSEPVFNPSGMTLDEALDEFSVMEVDYVPDLTGWFAVVDEDGINAYFSTSQAAFRHRLDLINRRLNQ